MKYTQFGQIPSQYINGLRIRNSVVLPLTRLRVGSGSMLSSNGDFQMISNDDMSCDIDKQGAGGVDAGTIIPNRVYGVYFITDSRNQYPPSIILSLSYGQAVLPPSMPYGYDAYGFIGCVTINSASEIEPGVWLGLNSFNRCFIYNNPIKILNAGTDTNYTFAGMLNCVPTFAFQKVNLNVDFNANAAADTVNLKYDLSASAQAIITAPVAGSIAHTTTSETILTRFTINGPGIDYKVSDGSVDLYVTGYELFLYRG